MRIRYNVASCLLVALGIALIGIAQTRSNVMPQHVASLSPIGAAAAAETVPAATHPIGTLERDSTRRVDFTIDPGVLDDFAERERRDQYLDWLLFAVVASFEPSPQALDQILYDLPTSRLGYLRPFGTFEYGEGRSRVLSDRRVVALVPAGQSEPARKDLLADIADAQRKNLGEAFDRLLVVEYTIDDKNASAALTLRGDVAYDALYSADYGYYTQNVASLADLTAFMARVDDLVTAAKSGTGLTLGGRKVLARKYRPIGVEHVATVWQSEQQIAQNPVAFGDVPGSGFSLDPHFDYESMSTAFDEVSAKFAKALPESINATELALVGAALKAHDPVPFFNLKRQLENEATIGAIVLAPALDKIEENAARQSARYDGALQGTDVGMILFYTDLIVKLWTIDIADSSPRRTAIANFVDDPSVHPSPIYKAEWKKYNHARAWFSPTANGFQLSARQDGLLFARNATRLFSAGSDPARPGEEVEASALLVAALDWWNDHYEEVARYEQEYERLNQIVKWSIVVGWLNAMHDTHRLAFLDGVTVDRANNFPAWTAKHPELRFRAWDKVRIRVVDGETESMPRLDGTVTRGGVSLATQKKTMRSPLATAHLAPERRSMLDYSSSDARRFKTIEGAVYRFQAADARTARFTVDAKPGARLRARTMQLAGALVARTTSILAKVIQFDTRVGERRFGSLEIANIGNALHIDFHARDEVLGGRIAETLSTQTDTYAALLADARVESVVRPGDGSYYAKLADGGRWVQFAVETTASVDVPPDWQQRAARPDAKRIFKVRATDDKELAVRESAARSFTVSRQAGGKLAIAAAFGPAPETAPVTLAVGTKKLDARYDEKSGTIWIDNSKSLLTYDEIARAFQGQYEHVEAAAKRGEHVLLATILSRERDDDVDRVLATLRRSPGDALRQVQALIQRHGDSARLAALEALLLADGGNAKAAAARLQKVNPDPTLPTLLDDVAAITSANNGKSGGSENAEAIRDYFAAPIKLAKGDVDIVADNGKLHLELRLGTGEIGRPLDAAVAATIDATKSRFYVDTRIDAALLSGSPSMANAIAKLVGSGKANLRAIDFRKIGTVSFAKIYAPEPTTDLPSQPFEHVKKTEADTRAEHKGHSPNSCDAEDLPGCTIYLVTAQS